MESLEDIEIIKEKIIKTDHVIQMYADLKSKYAELWKKYKQSIDDNSILKLDHERKTFQAVEQSKQIEKLNSEREKLTNEYNSLKLSHDDQLNEIVALQLKYQKVFQKFEEESDLAEPEKKRRKSTKRQKWVEKCGESSADESSKDNFCKYNEMMDTPSEYKMGKIEVLSCENNVGQQSLNNFQISFKQEQLEEGKKINQDLLEELNRCREEMSIYEKNSKEREMKLRTEWQAEEQKSKKRIEKLEEKIHSQRTLVKTSEMKEVEMRKKWEEKQRILEAKIADLEQKIQEEKCTVRKFEEKIHNMKIDWLEKENMLKVEMKVLEKRLQEEKSISLKNSEANIREVWQKKEQKLKMQILNLEDKIVSLQKPEVCEENLTHCLEQNPFMDNKYVNKLEPFTIELKQPVDLLENTVGLCRSREEDSTELTFFEEDTVDDGTIMNIFKEMRIPAMILPIPELKIDEGQVTKKEASVIMTDEPSVSVPPINITNESKHQNIAKDIITLVPETKQIDTVSTIGITADLKQETIFKDIIEPPVSNGIGCASTIENRDDLTEPLKEPKNSDLIDRYLINRKKKETKYHILSKIKKAKQKFWLGLGQTFITNKTDRRQPAKQKKKSLERIGSTSAITSEITVGSNNTLVNGIATVFADLVSQKLHNSRSRLKTTNERNVLEINKMLLEKAKQENETKHHNKLESSLMDLEISSCDETATKDNKDQLENERSGMNNSEHIKSHYETHSSGIDTPNFVDSCYESIISNPPSIQSDSKDNMIQEKIGNAELEQHSSIPKSCEESVSLDKKTHIETAIQEDNKSNGSYILNDAETQSELQSGSPTITVDKKATNRKSPRKSKSNVENNELKSVKRCKRTRKPIEMPTQKYNLRKRIKTKSYLSSDEEQLDDCYDDFKEKCDKIAPSCNSTIVNNASGTVEHPSECKDNLLKSEVPSTNEVEYHVRNKTCLKLDEENGIEDCNINESFSFDRLNESFCLETLNVSCKDIDISPFSVEDSSETKNDSLKAEHIPIPQELQQPTGSNINLKLDEENGTYQCHDHFAENCIGVNNINGFSHSEANNLNSSFETKCYSLQLKSNPISHEQQNNTSNIHLGEEKERTDQNHEVFNEECNIMSTENESFNKEEKISNTSETNFDPLKSEFIPIPQELLHQTKSETNSKSPEEKQLDHMEISASNSYSENELSLLKSELNNIPQELQGYIANGDKEMDHKEVETLNNSSEMEYGLKSEFISFPQELDFTESELYLESDDDEGEIDENYEDNNGKCNIMKIIDETFHMEASTLKYSENMENSSETFHIEPSTPKYPENIGNVSETFHMEASTPKLSENIENSSETFHMEAGTPKYSENKENSSETLHMEETTPKYSENIGNSSESFHMEASTPKLTENIENSSETFHMEAGTPKYSENKENSSETLHMEETTPKYSENIGNSSESFHMEASTPKLSENKENSSEAFHMEASTPKYSENKENSSETLHMEATTPKYSENIGNSSESFHMEASTPKLTENIENSSETFHMEASTPKYSENKENSPETLHMKATTPQYSENLGNSSESFHMEASTPKCSENSSETLHMEATTLQYSENRGNSSESFHMEASTPKCSENIENSSETFRMEPSTPKYPENIGNLSETFHMEASTPKYSENKENPSETKNHLLESKFNGTLNNSSETKPNPLSIYSEVKSALPLVSIDSSEPTENSLETEYNFLNPEYSCYSNEMDNTLKKESVNTLTDFSKQNITSSETKYNSTKSDLTGTVDNFAESGNNSLNTEFRSTFRSSSTPKVYSRRKNDSSKVGSKSTPNNSSETKFKLLKSEFKNPIQEVTMEKMCELKINKYQLAVTSILQEPQNHASGRICLESEEVTKKGEYNNYFNQQCDLDDAFHRRASTSNISSKTFSETKENMGIKINSSVECIIRTNLNTNSELNEDHPAVKSNKLNSSNESVGMENSYTLLKNTQEATNNSRKPKITVRVLKRKAPQKKTLMAKSLKIYRLKNSAIGGNQNEIGSSMKCNTNCLEVSNRSGESNHHNSSSESSQTTEKGFSSFTDAENMVPSSNNPEPTSNSNNHSITKNYSLNENEKSPVNAGTSSSCTNTPLKRNRKVNRKINSDTTSACIVSNVQQTINSGNPASTSNLEVNKYSCQQKKIVPSQLESSKINIIQDIILKSKNKNLKNCEQKTGGFKRPLASRVIPSCPQSPPPPSEEESANNFEPLNIPLDKPAKMNPDKAGSLFRKLITYSTEDKTVEEVARNFCNQEVDYISSLILEQIIQDKEKPDAKVPRAPLMTHTQRVMLGFMLKLEKMNVCNLIDTYLKTSELYLIKANALEPIETSTRLYVAICKSHGYIERIRRFCIDAFYFMGDFAIPFLFTVVTSWIEVLPPAKHSGSFPLVKVLIQLINLKTCNKPGYNLLPLRELLYKFYEYPNEYTNTDKFFQVLFSNYLRNPVAPNDFPILLYCKNSECKWVCQKIDTFIKPILPNIKNDNFKATLIILIGNIVNQFNGKLNSENVISLREWLKDMTKEEDIPEVVKRSIMYAIHKLPKTFKKTGKKTVVTKNV